MAADSPPVPARPGRTVAPSGTVLATRCGSGWRRAMGQARRMLVVEGVDRNRGLPRRQRAAAGVADSAQSAAESSARTATRSSAMMNGLRT